MAKVRNRRLDANVNLDNVETLARMLKQKRGQESALSPSEAAETASVRSPKLLALSPEAQAALREQAQTLPQRARRPNNRVLTSMSPEDRAAHLKSLQTPLSDGKTRA